MRAITAASQRTVATLGTTLLGVAMLGTPGVMRGSGVESMLRPGAVAAVPTGTTTGTTTIRAAALAAAVPRPAGIGGPPPQLQYSLVPVDPRHRIVAGPILTSQTDDASHGDRAPGVQGHRALGAHGDSGPGVYGDSVVPHGTALGAADSTTERYEVSGIRVIHRHVTGNSVVAANLYLLGGVRQTPPEQTGLEALLLEASERGTRKYPKLALRRRMSSLGSAVVSAPSEDWTLFGLRSTTATFDSTWAILADRVMAPRLDSLEVEQVRSLFATGVRQRRDSPDALLEYLADSAAFAGHPYGLSPTGTEQSIATITLADLRRYEREQMVKSRMLLVVVGNVERARVERLVGATLATLPQGSYQWKTPDRIAEHRGATVIVPRSLPTNYILGYYSGPAATSADYPALRVAAAVLSGRLYAEIRSRRNLTYAVDAPFLERAVSAGGLYVTTVSPDVTLDLMHREIEGLRNDQIGAAGLERLVQQFITDYFLDNETNSDQANFLARAELYRGDYRMVDRFVEDLRQVTPADVRRVATRYMRNMTFAYIGDPSRLNAKLVEQF